MPSSGNSSDNSGRDECVKCGTQYDLEDHHGVAMCVDCLIEEVC